MNYCPNCGYHLTNITPTLVGCPTEGTCNWRFQVDSRAYVCAHGAIMSTHPNGWCDQGCCR